MTATRLPFSVVYPKALRRAKVPKAEIDAFMAEATSGDYDHLLATVMATVNENGEEEEE